MSGSGVISSHCSSSLSRPRSSGVRAARPTSTATSRWSLRRHRGAGPLCATRRPCRHDRRQPQVPVREVHHQQSVRGQLLEIHLHRLVRDEMDGNRVGTEGVDQQHVEVAVRLAGSVSRASPMRISAARFAAIAEIREELGVLRDLPHRRVDLEIGQLLPRPGVGGHGTGPQAHHADVAVAAKRVAKLQASKTSPTGPVRW